MVLSEDGILRVELQTKDADKYSAHLELEVSRHYGEFREARA